MSLSRNVSIIFLCMFTHVQTRNAHKSLKNLYRGWLTNINRRPKYFSQSIPVVTVIFNSYGEYIASFIAVVPLWSDNIFDKNGNLPDLVLYQVTRLYKEKRLTFAGKYWSERCLPSLVCLGFWRFCWYNTIATKYQSFK